MILTLVFELKMRAKCTNRLPLSTNLHNVALPHLPHPNAGGRDVGGVDDLQVHNSIRDALPCSLSSVQRRFLYAVLSFLPFCQ